MKKIILISGLILSLSPLSAQKVVALHHVGNTTLYNTLNAVNDAVAAAQNGDTIYIPGATYTIGNLIIDKSLTIFGVGHYADSTQATGITNLSGEIHLITGADNSFLQGFYLTGNIYLGTVDSNDAVNNINISRVNLNTLYLSFNGTDTNTASGIVISENWIRNSLYGGYTLNTIVRRNLIYGQIGNFRNLIFFNNFHVGYYCNNGPYRNISNSLLRNNVTWFHFGNCNGNYLISGYSNDFQYNSFVSNYTFPIGTNTGSNNWYSTSPSTLMVNCPSYALNYTYDYHLQTPSSFLGSDGTEIGIYGTTSPYKEGGVPKNPHIQSVSIADTTNQSGLLQIDIKVGAQNK